MSADDTLEALVEQIFRAACTYRPHDEDRAAFRKILAPLVERAEMGDSWMVHAEQRGITNDRLVRALKQVERERDGYKTLSETQAATLTTFQALQGDPWRWMGDGSDHPESLACPVLMSPDHVREFVRDRDRLAAMLKDVGVIDEVMYSYPKMLARDVRRIVAWGNLRAHLDATEGEPDADTD